MPVVRSANQVLRQRSLSNHYQRCKRKVCIVFKVVTIFVSDDADAAIEECLTSSDAITESLVTARGRLVKMHASCFKAISDSTRFALWGHNYEVTGPIIKEYHNVHQFMVPIPPYAFETCPVCSGQLLKQFETKDCPYCQCK